MNRYNYYDSFDLTKEIPDSANKLALETVAKFNSKDAIACFRDIMNKRRFGKLVLFNLDKNRPDATFEFHKGVVKIMKLVEFWKEGKIDKSHQKTDKYFTWFEMSVIPKDTNWGKKPK